MNATPTTPKKLFTSIKNFLEDAGLNGKSQFLLFFETALEYHAGYCLDNCEAEQIRTGCEIVYGWVIWENPKSRFIEAEFHAVVRKNGALLDITPRFDGERRVLFVEDKNRKPQRMDDHTWQTWSNIKSQDEEIFEECRELEIENVGTTVSEKREQNTSE